MFNRFEIMMSLYNNGFSEVGKRFWCWYNRLSKANSMCNSFFGITATSPNISSVRILSRSSTSERKTNEPEVRRPIMADVQDLLCVALVIQQNSRINIRLLNKSSTRFRNLTIVIADDFQAYKSAHDCLCLPGIPNFRPRTFALVTLGLTKNQ